MTAVRVREDENRAVIVELCEHEAAEAIVQGVLDHVVPKRRIRGDSVCIGRDTGAEEFPALSGSTG